MTHLPSCGQHKQRMCLTQPGDRFFFVEGQQNKVQQDQERGETGNEGQNLENESTAVGVEATSSDPRGAFIVFTHLHAHNK